MTRKRIYLAGPYSCEGRCKPLGVDLQHMRQGLKVCAKLMATGYAPFCPWLDYLYHFVAADDLIPSKLDYYDYSMAWLEASDAVYCISLRPTSHGTIAEINRANELGIPVFYNIHELVEALSIGEENQTRRIEK